MRISDWSSDVCSSDLSAAIPSSPTPVRRVRPLQAISVQRWCVLSARNIIRSLSGTLPDRRGVAAIELAFTLPVLTFLSLGAFDVARMLSAQIDYQQAAAEVASLALARPPQSDTAYLQQAAMSASGLTEEKRSDERRVGKESDS